MLAEFMDPAVLGFILIGVMLFSILSSLRTLYLWNEKRGKFEVNVLKKELVSVLIAGIV